MKKFSSLVLTVVLLAAMLTAFSIPTSAKESAPADAPKGTVFQASTEDAQKGGSILSNGSLTVIVGIGSAVAGVAIGFFIGRATEKKKNSSVVNGTEKED